MHKGWSHVYLFCPYEIAAVDRCERLTRQLLRRQSSLLSTEVVEERVCLALDDTQPILFSFTTVVDTYVL